MKKLIFLNLMISFIFQLLSSGLGEAKVGDITFERSNQSKHRWVNAKMMNNRFRITLPDGDYGSVYFNEDESINYIPAATNTVYNNNCWGKWDFNEDAQKIDIEVDKKCYFFSGVYKVSRFNRTIYLQNPHNKLVLQVFYDKH